MGTGRERPTVSAGGEDLDRRLQATFDEVVSDDQVAGSPGFQPPEFRRDQHCCHPAFDDAVAADIAFAGFDEDAPRAVVAEVAVLYDEPAADPQRAAHRGSGWQRGFAIQRERVEPRFSCQKSYADAFVQTELADEGFFLPGVRRRWQLALRGLRAR